MARTDSYRYLEAGAVQSFWVRTLPGHLSKAMPRIGEKIARAHNVVIESNSVMEFLRPNVYAMVVSSGMSDFKPTARRYLERADAILMTGATEIGEAHWPETVRERIGEIPRLSFDPARYISPGFLAFLRRRLDGRG